MEHIKTKLAITLLLVSATSCVLRAPFDGLNSGTPAPSLGITKWFNVDHQATDIASFQGRPVLLEFWSTDCPPCVESVDKMKALASSENQDLQVVTVHVDLDREQPISPIDLENFLGQNQITYPVAMDSNGEQWERYEFHYLPHAVLLDANGLVEWSGNLVYYDLGEELENRITKWSPLAESENCADGVCAPTP